MVTLLPLNPRRYLFGRYLYGCPLQASDEDPELYRVVWICGCTARRWTGSRAARLPAGRQGLLRAAHQSPARRDDAQPRWRPRQVRRRQTAQRSEPGQYAPDSGCDEGPVVAMRHQADCFRGGNTRRPHLLAACDTGFCGYPRRPVHLGLQFDQIVLQSFMRRYISEK
jgi:hypothetical protein